MKKLILCFVFLFLSACDTGGDSDSGGMTVPTIPGTNIPAEFLGTYTGTLNVRAEALGFSESDSFPITITVTDDGMIRFDGDDPDETFTVALQDNGEFRDTVSIQEVDADLDECDGTITIDGSVNGTQVTGTLAGEGTCLISGINADVTLTGDFSASK